MQIFPRPPSRLIPHPSYVPSPFPAQILTHVHSHLRAHRSRSIQRPAATRSEQPSGSAATLLECDLRVEGAASIVRPIPSYSVLHTFHRVLRIDVNAVCSLEPVVRSNVKTLTPHAMCSRCVFIAWIARRITARDRAVRRLDRPNACAEPP